MLADGQVPGPTWAVAPTASGLAVPGATDAPLADGARSSRHELGLGWATVLRPTTPATAGARVDGTAGAAEAKRASRPPRQPGGDQGDVEGPLHLAGRARHRDQQPVGEVAPTVSPVDVSQDRADVMVAATGPKSAANWPRPR